MLSLRKGRKNPSVIGVGGGVKKDPGVNLFFCEIFPSPRVINGYRPNENGLDPVRSSNSEALVENSRKAQNYEGLRGPGLRNVGLDGKPALATIKTCVISGFGGETRFGVIWHSFCRGERVRGGWFGWFGWGGGIPPGRATIGTATGPIRIDIIIHVGSKGSG